jgi:hypothetical protein
MRFTRQSNLLLPCLKEFASELWSEQVAFLWREMEETSSASDLEPNRTAFFKGLASSSKEWKAASQVLAWMRVQASFQPFTAAFEEEQMDRIVAIAEEAARGGMAVVVDAAGVEAQPVLQAFLERFTPGPESPVIVLGDSPAARDLRENPGLLFSGGLGELAGLLMGLKESRGITHVTYLSSSGIFQVRPVAQEIGLSFDQRTPSLKDLLGVFMPAPLAAELAAGAEGAELLGGQV